jgi:hypothetical protein
MLADLLVKFVSRIKEAETVIIRFGNKLGTAGFSQRVKGAHDFGAVFLELFENHSCDAEGDFESAFVAANHLQQEPVGRQVAFVGDFSANGGVFEFIEVADRFVKDGIMPEAEGLMNLKVKTNRGHSGTSFSAVVYVATWAAMS